MTPTVVGLQNLFAADIPLKIELGQNGDHIIILVSSIFCLLKEDYDPNIYPIIIV